MLNDKETKTSLRINQIKAQRKVVVQDVLIEGKSLKLDESDNATEKSMQPS